MATALGAVSTTRAFEGYAFPDQPIRLVKVGGINLCNSQSCSVNNGSASLFVQAQDQYGNPVANIPVTFETTNLDPYGETCEQSPVSASVAADADSVTSSVGASALLISGRGFQSHGIVARADNLDGMAEHIAPGPLCLPVNNTGCNTEVIV